MRSPPRAALLASLVLPLLVAFSDSAAEIYRWTDASGREHFTQSLGQVPAEYRRQAEAAAITARRSQSPSRVQTFSTRPPSSRAALPTAGSAAGAAGKVHRIRVARAGTNMLVNVRLNNSVTAPFLIDTGASDVTVPMAVARKLGLDLENARTQRYNTANGVIESPVLMLRSVSLGTATVENVPASVSSSMSVGLLGLSFFNHFTVSVDAANGIVTLRPNQLAASGRIRGGRSEAQWRAEFRSLQYRRESIEHEHAGKSVSKARGRQRLEAELTELERQRGILEMEADQARVPMAWRE